MTRSVWIALVFSTLLLALSTPPAQSAMKSLTGKGTVVEFKIDSQSLKTLVPQDWEPITGVLNTPLALLSKKGLQDVRTVIQIVPYGIQDLEDDLQKFKKDPEEYYSQKEDWLESTDGEAISYEPYEESKKEGATIRSIGIKYKNSMGQFLDKTWYISSQSKALIYVKAVIPLDLEKAHTAEVDRVIVSLSQQN